MTWTTDEQQRMRAALEGFLRDFQAFLESALVKWLEQHSDIKRSTGEPRLD